MSLKCGNHFLSEDTHGCRCVGLGDEVKVDLQRGGAETAHLGGISSDLLAYVFRSADPDGAAAEQRIEVGCPQSVQMLIVSGVVLGRCAGAPP